MENAARLSQTGGNRLLLALGILRPPANGPPPFRIPEGAMRAQSYRITPALLSVEDDITFSTGTWPGYASPFAPSIQAGDRQCPRGRQRMSISILPFNRAQLNAVLRAGRRRLKLSVFRPKTPSKMPVDN
jgi:hypothetical protein